MDPEIGSVRNQNYVARKQQGAAGEYRPKQELKMFSGVKDVSAKDGISNQWVERGPYSVGGRVRGIMFDPNDASGKKVWAGGVSGGLWYNNDITDANSEWTLVDAFWSNTTVSCITSDQNSLLNSKIGYRHSFNRIDADVFVISNNLLNNINYTFLFYGNSINDSDVDSQYNDPNVFTDVNPGPSKAYFFTGRNLRYQF